VTSFLQLLFAGLALGSVYALVALGFVIIYRASGVFNFAQGELVTLGAFVMVALSLAGLPWALAAVGAMIAVGVIAAGIERGLLRPLLGRPIFVPIILTIIVGLLLRTAMIVIWGTHPRGVPTPWDTTATVELLGTRILYNSLATVVAAALALAGFLLIARYTRLGLGMRASSSDQEAALAVGIPVGRIFGVTWFLAGAFAALAGIFLATFPRSADVNLAFVALRALPAVIVGGLTSASGAVIAGLSLGVLEVLAEGYVNPRLGDFGHNFHTVFPYLVMIAFLVIRPYGLFGQKEVERV
jgi:branched-chain amino acid transport system permease protein